MTTWRASFVCFVIAASTLTASAGGGQRVRSDQDILMQLERDWDAAFHRHDVAFIEGLLADEFIATYDNGVRADKARELELAADRSQQIDASSLDEFIVKTYRDTAVVWFTLHLTGTSQGRPLNLTLRYTDVWVLRDGRWQCVSSHSTRLAAPQ
ncbi:MAG: nuclear transport factor 2 family protein [Acidobacteria bacterium]|nr:nuclear transport factor 2 family protein [Acidobacteriota bacterium]